MPDGVSPGRGGPRLNAYRRRLLIEYIHLMKNGKDPTMPSVRTDSPDTEDIRRDLQEAEEAMSMLQAQYACVDAAARLTTSPPPTGFYLHPGRENAAISIQWLRTHYEEKEGISLPRSAMFGHYLDYCQQANLDPINQATFGKIIRMVFPEVKTRRLGTRGQSKYHYYGLTIKDTSPYKEIMLNAQRVNNYLGEPSGKGMYSRTVAQSSLACSPTMSDEGFHGTVLLQDFPSASTVSFPDDKKDTVAVFLMMYRHHSQRVLDTVLRANFSEVKEFVVHFWQSLPTHIHSVLRHDKLIQTIALCDSVLYKAMVGLLIPGLLQPLPTSLMMAIRSFGRDLVTWLSDALKAHPSELRLRKIQVAKRFSRCLWRQTALSHMASVARSFLHSGDLMQKLSQDWENLDLDMVVKDIARDLSFIPATRHRLQSMMEDFGGLVRRQAHLNQYLDWVRGVYVNTVREKYESTQGVGVQGTRGVGVQGASRLVLLHWSFIIKIIIRELTLSSADMFGPYHLLGLLFQDYAMFLTEEWQRAEAVHHIKTSVYDDQAQEYIPDWEKEASIGPEARNPSNHHPPKYLSPEKVSPLSTEYHPHTPNQRPIPTTHYPKHGYTNYSSIPPGQCNLSDCHDDMVRQNRAFDGDMERTSPDEGSARALDLSVNFNSSLTEDDALVDTVISKGYATLDDCSNVLSPVTWKRQRTPAVTSSPHTQSPPMRFSSFSTTTHSHHQLGSVGYSPAISDSDYIGTSPIYGTPIRGSSLIGEYPGGTPNYSPAIYSNSSSSSSHASPNPGINPSYSRRYTYTPQSYTVVKEGLNDGQASPEGYRGSTLTIQSPQYREGAYPFTHISGSVQMAPMNPRKKWLMEEELRTGLLQSTSSRIQPT